MDPRMAMQLGQNFKGGASQLLGGLFGNSSAPYDEAMNQYSRYGRQGQERQNPFYNAGTNALPGFQEWLQGQKDPSAYINHLMSGYQESPWAHNQQQQAMRAATNMGSASGLTGSTPLMMQAQQNAGNISSEDQNRWLEHVLGINTQYGKGMNDLVHGGQGAANQQSDMYMKLAQLMGEGAFGSKAGQNQDRSNIIGGLLSMFM